jgi:hypothetical protein
VTVEGIFYVVGLAAFGAALAVAGWSLWSTRR